MTQLQDKYAFGWIEHPWSYHTPQFEVFPTDDFPLAIAEVANGNFASEKWIYPPIIEQAIDNVAGPAERFELLPTHYLKINSKIDRANLSHFLISILGFLLGLKLNPVGFGHLQRTPRRMGSLVSFSDMGRDLEHAISRVIEFFLAHEKNDEIRLLTEAAFHWYLISQSYYQTFEKFTFQYSVLDNVHKLSKLLHPVYNRSADKRHSQRPINLSAFYGIPLPPSFRDTSISQPNAGHLAAVRNELVHEARWLGQPLGYTANSATWELLLDLRHFNSQLLLAVVGIECKFRSTLRTRQIHGLDVTN